jgi:hypothetical protein
MSCAALIAALLGMHSTGLWAASPPTSAADLAAWIEKRVQGWQPTRQERRFDDIGWAKDIRQALQLAKTHQRPVFLFTYDGESLAGYRC